MSFALGMVAGIVAVVVGGALCGLILSGRGNWP